MRSWTFPLFSQKSFWIVDVSTALAQKMLEREVNKEDHRALIDSFIEKIGEEQ